MTQPPFGVLYVDNHLLVVDKPAGMLTQGDATGDPDLVSHAKAYLKERFKRPGDVFVGLVHRLDRPVGGVVVLARTSKAAARLSAQFAGRDVEKRYLAVVEGRLEGAGERVDWLVKGERGTVHRVPEGTTGAKRAALRWESLAVEGRRTLVGVDLETGRAHQIRVQLAWLGVHVVGDLRYGAKTPLGDGRGIALHAVRLGIEHPTLRERAVFASRPPWRGLLDEAVARVTK
ncbi:MAG TPA: RNA pseudouridine synthase [Rubricoccaceae bacterium]